MNDRPSSNETGKDFAELADAKRSGVVAEFFAFLKHNKKWWLAPLLILIGLLGLLVFLGGTGALPWLYPLF